MTGKSNSTTTDKVDIYEVTMPLLRAMYSEFKEFSKKKPDEAVSKAKIRVVNRLLVQCQKVLESEASIDYLDILDEDDVPQNSDVVLMLSQYVTAMNQFRITYYREKGYGYDAEWIVE
jgi:hypothetical protein